MKTVAVTTARIRPRRDFHCGCTAIRPCRRLPSAGTELMASALVLPISSRFIGDSSHSGLLMAWMPRLVEEGSNFCQRWRTKQSLVQVSLC